MIVKEQMSQRDEMGSRNGARKLLDIVIVTDVEEDEQSRRAEIFQGMTSGIVTRMWRMPNRLLESLQLAKSDADSIPKRIPVTDCRERLRGSTPRPASLVLAQVYNAGGDTKT